MMTRHLSNSSPGGTPIVSAKAQYVLSLIVGFLFGLLGQLGQKPVASLFTSLVLITVFTIFSQTLQRQRPLSAGLVTGGFIGLTLALLNWLVVGQVTGGGSGLIFGLSRGAAIGAIAGWLTRAPSDSHDPLTTRLVLFVGSIFLGAVLGGGVGLIAGFILGFLGTGWTAVIGGLLMGGIVGGYLGAYYEAVRWIRNGIVAGAVLAAVSALAGGTLSGIVLGAFSGALAPMIFVALIGAWGGLFNRGVKAMVVEALEAPVEMLDQGAVPFLLPAVVVGIIVGGGASGNGALVALPGSLGLMALTLTALLEIDKRPNSQDLTVQAMVETIMMGADNWPVSRLLQQLFATMKSWGLWTAVALRLIIGGVSSIIGTICGYGLIRVITAVFTNQP